jgi:hypothetical protein
MGQNVGCGSCPDCGTENRVHILAVAFRLMRQILVDYARSHAADKRGADLKVELHAAQLLPQERSADVVALDDAVTQIPRLDEQQGRIVEMRFFGGPAIEEWVSAIVAPPLNRSGTVICLGTYTTCRRAQPGDELPKERLTKPNRHFIRAAKRR